MNKNIVPFPKAQEPEKKEAKIPLPSNTTVCDLCKRQFNVTKDSLREETVVLHKVLGEGIETAHEVKLTFLSCPSCGKNYPVIMDDETTLPLLAELRETLGRRMKFARKGNPIPSKLEEKYKKLNRKLDFKRHQLAEKFAESFYQLEDGTTQQLDYRYHAR